MRGEGSSDSEVEETVSRASEMCLSIKVASCEHGSAIVSASESLSRKSTLLDRAPESPRESKPGGSDASRSSMSFRPKVANEEPTLIPAKGGSQSEEEI